MAKRITRKDGKPTRREKSRENRKQYRRVARSMKDPRPEPKQLREVTDQDLEDVLDAISRGDTLKGKCRELRVCEGTVRLRFASDEQLSTRYARAKLDQAHAMVEQSIQDFEALDRIQTGAIGANVEVSIVKHKFEVRRWLAGKLHVGAYGDKVTAVIEGGDRPVKTVSREMSAEEALAAYEEERKRGG